jgi:hypothetical protein
LNHHPSDLSLPSSYDYRNKPTHLDCNFKHKFFCLFFKHLVPLESTLKKKKSAMIEVSNIDSWDKDKGKLHPSGDSLSIILKGIINIVMCISKDIKWCGVLLFFTYMMSRSLKKVKGPPSALKCFFGVEWTPVLNCRNLAFLLVSFIFSIILFPL